MEGFSSNLNDTFTSTRGCGEPMFFPQHILPLLPLYNAQWWGYESLTAIALVRIMPNILECSDQQNQKQIQTYPKPMSLRNIFE